MVDTKAVDPITFEVLRHRFGAIVEEGALVMRNVSGSPSVAYSNDCNVVLLDAEGNAVQMGWTLPTHSISCINLVRYVLTEFRTNPGFGPGDVFLSNDPYRCTPHQNCAVACAPVFAGDELIAWVGTGVHFSDMGGPVESQSAIGAGSIYGEPPYLPPVKIVEGGVARKDIEEVFLYRSRTRAQNTLDYKAMIASSNTMKQRLEENINRYGAGVVRAALDRLLRLNEERVRAVLTELPDGEWRQTVFMDYRGADVTDFYECRLRMSKRGSTLTFDFTGSSEQAPAVINCTRSSLETSVMIPLVSMFGFVIPPCPTAVMRAVEVVSEPGSVVDCSWPAGVSKGTTSMSLSVRHAVTHCMSQLFGSDPRYLDHARAVCNGHRAIQQLLGNDDSGERFAGAFVDMLGGFGACASGDGLDSGGPIEGPDRTIPDVEINELYFPILYLYRREATDTGGPGKYRGGAGLSAAITPHGTETISSFIIDSIGVEVPTAIGVNGGYPGAVIEMSIKRDTEIATLLRDGFIPAQRDDLSGDEEISVGMNRTSLVKGDVFFCTSCGGGGYGDPLTRDPERVVADVQSGLVSRTAAAEVYGVDIDDDGQISAAVTERRSAMISVRQDGARVESAASWSEDAGVDRPVCASCGAAADQDSSIAVGDRACSDFPPYERSNPIFALRETFCTKCWEIIDVAVVQPAGSGA